MTKKKSGVNELDMVSGYRGVCEQNPHFTVLSKRTQKTSKTKPVETNKKKDSSQDIIVGDYREDRWVGLSVVQDNSDEGIREFTSMKGGESVDGEITSK